MPSIRDNDDLKRIAIQTDVSALRKTFDEFMQERLNGKSLGDISDAEMNFLFDAADKHMQSKHGISIWDAMILINNSVQTDLPEETLRRKTWEILYEELSRSLGVLGENNAYGDGDFWLVDDDYGDATHKLCIARLSFLQPQVIKTIQHCLKAHPHWRLLVQIEAEFNGERLPPEGLIVYADHVEQLWDKIRFASVAKSLGI